MQALGGPLEKGPSPLNLTALNVLLGGYPNRQDMKRGLGYRWRGPGGPSLQEIEIDLEFRTGCTEQNSQRGT